MSLKPWVREALQQPYTCLSCKEATGKTIFKGLGAVVFCSFKCMMEYPEEDDLRDQIDTMIVEAFDEATGRK